MGTTSASVRLSKLTLLLVVVGAACAVSAAQPRAAERAPKGTLTIAVDAFDPHLLPIGNATTQGYREDFMIFERLAEYNFEQKAVPILAESIKSDKTGRVWTVKLRKNVKFTDGKSLASEDVVYSFLYALDPSHGFLQRGRLTAIKRITAVNRTTVRFTLFNPLSSFIDALTFVGIAPKHAMASDPAAFSVKPIGTGPFVLSQFVPNDRIVLNANLKYWGRAPSVSRLIFRYMPDATTRLAALASGQVDIVAPLLATQINELRSRRGLSFKGVASTQRVDLWVKNTVPPFTNKLVRQALSYAIDRRAIVYAAAPGSTAAIGPITRASWGYDPTIKGYTYNPAKAKALLAQAGHRSGVDFELLISTRAGEDREAALIQQQAAAAGFRVRIKTMEYTSLVQQVVAKRDYQVVRITATQTPDPDSMTYIYFNSQSPGNYYGYSSPVVDRLLDQGRSIVDQGARKKVYSQLQKKLLDDAPNIWMYYNKLFFGIGPKEKNFRPLATGYLAIKTTYGADVSKGP